MRLFESQPENNDTAADRQEILEDARNAQKYLRSYKEAITSAQELVTSDDTDGFEEVQAQQQEAHTKLIEALKELRDELPPGDARTQLDVLLADDPQETRRNVMQWAAQQQMGEGGEERFDIEGLVDALRNQYGRAA